ncbi:hypothetical protein AVEN_109029-1 [Araneus ventricosus]|uniref:Uncharacterized protein n=1 Tax=Araneus ventricosus TaxID=182803 RepID=A0A4Y2HMJ2_ARAVE|nr:hypothetical protein AVEN_109029-1 [Araneus ventricosus]
MIYFHFQPLPNVVYQSEPRNNHLSISINPFLSLPPTRLIAVKTEAIWTSSAMPLPKTRSHCNLKTDSYSTRLPTTQFRFKGEWIGYWPFQIQKYQVNVSGTNEYQYQHVSDTAKPCINPTLIAANLEFPQVITHQI